MTFSCWAESYKTAKPLISQIFAVHNNPHAGAAPAQIGMKTEAAEFSAFMWYNVLKRGKLRWTKR